MFGRIYEYFLTQFADQKAPDNGEFFTPVILSAYDDLIENNRRRIGLLERASRLLYREWFVHFRFPGHEKAKMVDGKPEGWEVRLLPGRAAESGRTWCLL